MQEYAAVVPVKPPAHGKSRLGGLSGVPDDQRHALAEAFALDTVSACLATPGVAHVLVATDDPGLAVRVAALGASAVPDGDARGLNPVLRQTVDEVVRRWPSVRPVAVCADLPALQATDLRSALDQAAAVPGAAYVADHEGTGTTLYTAPPERFAPQFGPGSARAHRDGGAVALSGELATLRRDVDHLRDLEVAARLGLGAATTAAWSAGP